MEPLTEMRSLALGHATSREGLHETAVPRLHIYRANERSIPTPNVYEPMICLVIAGKKCGFIGDESIHYEAGDILLVSIDLPMVSQILEAGPDSPYLAVGLALHRPTLAAVMLESSERDMVTCELDGAFRVMQGTAEILDAFLRLLRLNEEPRDIAVLAPLIERELLYRLLISPAGGVLREMTRSDSRISQVIRAIAWLRENFDQKYSAEALAKAAGMSRSTLNRQFRTMTAMSPLEYQKSLRLQEARRLMLAKDAGAEVVGYTVGYSSVAQFTREYRRMFGSPPGRDAEQMRSRIRASASYS